MHTHLQEFRDGSMAILAIFESDSVNSSPGNMISDFDLNNFKNLPAPTWLKVSGAISYILQVGGSFVLITFDYFEQRGKFGKHRSVINLLNSWIHVHIVFFCVITVGIDLARLILGPLPTLLCEWHAVVKNMIGLSMVCLNVVIAYLKFMFICVWKSYRHMNHSWMSYFVVMTSLLISFLFGLIQIFGPGRTTMFVNVCTATFFESENLVEAKINSIGGATLTGLAMYIGFGAIIAIKRLQYRKERQNPKSKKHLISLMFNLAYLVLIASAGIMLNSLNSYANANEVDIRSVWMYPMYMYFITPVAILALAILRITFKHGKIIFKS